MEAKIVVSGKTREWMLVAAAASILAISSGTMKTFGLFVAPLTRIAGLSITSVSLAFAVGQVISGIAQPVFCAVADSRGAARVLTGSALLIFTGFSITAAFHTGWSIVFTVGVICATGWAAAEYSILIGAVSRKLRPGYQALAGGLINAGGSVGQFMFAPLLQMTISGYGWVTAMLAISGIALIIFPLSLIFREPSTGRLERKKTIGAGTQIKIALRSPDYLLLHAGFFTCGFHVTFLSAHLANDIFLHGHAGGVSAAVLSITGIFSIAGSLFSGMLGLKFKMKHILAGVYGSRAVMIGLFFLSARTEFEYYVFSAALGFTWLATVAPTSELVRKLFGTEYLSTLFGLTMFSHQAGAFLGAWSGGLIVSLTGNYDMVWIIDLLLALFAVTVNLSIREPGKAEV
ncbi:MAG: MFS transporter [Synergistaceae bacterium]|nr:MFS transporter [Synergistaceae bacterium]